MKRRGRKTLEWERVRRELKREFEAAGITRCENCGRDYALSFAHRLKRRYIDNEAELRCVALLCQKCHDGFECQSHANMFSNITDIIILCGRSVPFAFWGDRPCGVV